MAKPPVSSYAALSLDVAPPPAVKAERKPRQSQPKTAAPSSAKGGEKAQPYVAYLNPAGHRALRLYALESGGSVQAIIIEAVEAWARSHGITEPMKPERTK